MRKPRTRMVTLGLSVLLFLSMLVGFEARSAVAVQPGAMGFGALDHRISYGIPAYDNLQVQEADLNMLISTGASCIRTDIGYAPWLQGDSVTISLIDNVVSQIKSAQKCLVLADASSETYRSTPIPWSDFKTAWVQRVQTLAQRYLPDYYIVVKEPRWYSSMISDATTNPAVQNSSEWVSLTQNLTTAVHSVSPNTKVGVSIDANTLNTKFASLYISYLGGVSNLAGVNFIGFDVYSSTDQTATQSYLTQNGSGGKDVWVSETWSGDGPSVYDPSRAQSDAQWMSSAYQFATQINAKFLIPFYTDLFSSYSWDTNPTDIVANYNLRQPVYYTFQSLVEQYGIAPVGVPEFNSSMVTVAVASVLALALFKRKAATTAH